jgi:hypothetical protein
VIIASGPNVWTIAALEVVAGACVTASFSLWETSIQEHIPGDALSRVSSDDYFASTGSLPLGNILAGVLSTGFGVPLALFAMGGVGIVSPHSASPPSPRSGACHAAHPGTPSPWRRASTELGQLVVAQRESE